MTKLTIGRHEVELHDDPTVAQWYAIVAVRPLDTARPADMYRFQVDYLAAVAGVSGAELLAELSAQPFDAVMKLFDAVQLAWKPGFDARLREQPEPVAPKPAPDGQ